jgi:hypothetical protein
MKCPFNRQLDLIRDGSTLRAVFAGDLTIKGGSLSLLYQAAGEVDRTRPAALVLDMSGVDSIDAHVVPGLEAITSAASKAGTAVQVIAGGQVGAFLARKNFNVNEN